MMSSSSFAFATPQSSGSKGSALSLSALSNSGITPASRPFYMGASSSGSGGGAAGSVGSSGSGATQSILGAYRELQAKARAVEKARADAMHERDELRRQALQSKRHQAIARSRNESQGNEAILAIRTSCETVRAAQLDASARLYTADANLQTKHREMVEQERELATLEEILMEQQAHRAAMQRSNQELESELESETRRFELLQGKHKALAVQHCAEVTHAKDEVNVLRLERKQLHDSDSRVRLRAAAMHRYISLVLNINGDLVSSLERQTAAAKKLEEFVVLPRYSWPRGQFYSTLNLVTTTATDTIYSKKKRIRLLRRAGSLKGLPAQRLQTTGAVAMKAAIRHSSPMSLIQESVPRKKMQRKKCKRKTGAVVGASSGDDDNVGAGVSNTVSAADFLNAIMKQSRENAQALRLAKQQRRQAGQGPTKMPSYMLPKTY